MKRPESKKVVAMIDHYQYGPNLVFKTLLRKCSAWLWKEFFEHIDTEKR